MVLRSDGELATAIPRVKPSAHLIMRAKARASTSLPEVTKAEV